MDNKQCSNGKRNGTPGHGNQERKKRNKGEINTQTKKNFQRSTLNMKVACADERKH